MKVAVDVTVSEFEKHVLRCMGFTLLCCEHSEKDEDFFLRTDDFLPEIYVSMDQDWIDHAKLVGASFVRMREGERTVLRNVYNAALQRESLVTVCLDSKFKKSYGDQRKASC